MAFLLQNQLSTEMREMKKITHFSCTTRTDREQSKEDDHLKQGTADYFKLELYLNQAVTGLTWHLLVNNSRTSRKSELPLFEQNTTRWSMADKVYILEADLLVLETDSLLG
ncbi:TPA: hypothetical protein ACH3X3_012185 [Trebouxia sp. C0006]